MAYISGYDKTKIHYEVSGHGEPSLVFVHGWAGHSGLWKHQMEYFSGFSRVVAIDLRGQGFSTWQEDTVYENIFDTLLSDFEILKETLGLERAIFIGWSLGGMLGIMLAARQVPWLQGLVVVGGTPKFLRSDDFPSGLEEDVAGRIRKHFERHPLKTLKSCYAGYLSAQEKNLGITDGDIVLPHVKGALNTFDRLCETDLRPELRKIKIPTFICHGTDDAVCPAQAAVYLKNHIEISRLEFFEGAGHIPFFTDPHRFNKTLKRFCRIFLSRSRFERDALDILREK